MGIAFFRGEACWVFWPRQYSVGAYLGEGANLTKYRNYCSLLTESLLLKFFDSDTSQNDDY